MELRLFRTSEHALKFSTKPSPVYHEMIKHPDTLADSAVLTDFSYSELGLRLSSLPAIKLLESNNYY